jgi:hypothetical protein
LIESDLHNALLEIQPEYTIKDVENFHLQSESETIGYFVACLAKVNCSADDLIGEFRCFLRTLENFQAIHSR